MTKADQGQHSAPQSSSMALAHTTASLPVRGQTAFPRPAIDDADSPEAGCPICGNHVAFLVARSQTFKLLQCTACDLVTRHMISPQQGQKCDFKDPVPLEDRMPRGHSDLNAFFGLRAAKTSLARMRKALAYPFPSPKPSFLDVGSGRGFLVEAARQAGFNAFGIDPNPLHSDWAQKHFPEACYHTLKIEDLTQDHIKSLLECDSGPLDFVYCGLALQECEDLILFVESVAHLIATGGYLWVKVNNYNHWRRSNHLSNWPLYWPERDHYLFTKQTLKTLFTRAGFSVILKDHWWHQSLTVIARKQDSCSPDFFNPFPNPMRETVIATLSSNQRTFN